VSVVDIVLVLIMNSDLVTKSRHVINGINRRKNVKSLHLFEKLSIYYDSSNSFVFLKK